jgi:RNA polymerase sigma factor FliA
LELDMTLAIEKPVTAPVLSASELDDLVRTHLPLVGHLVREVANRIPSHINRDDLTSAGMYALAACARTFDPTLGVPFGSFATIRIRGALTDELRSMDWVSRSVRGRSRNLDATREQLTQALGRTPSAAELSQALGVSIGELASIESDSHRSTVLSLHALSPEDGVELVPDRGEGPESLLLRREQIGYLRDAVAELPERLQTVVVGYFFEQRKMADIADELGVTESRVSQLRSQALAILLEGMKAAQGETVVEDAAPTRRRGTDPAAYRAAVARRSTLAERLAQTTVMGEALPAGA